MPKIFPSVVKRPQKYGCMNLDNSDLHQLCAIYIVFYIATMLSICELDIYMMLVSQN